MEIEVPLVLFTFFTCLASGIFFMQGVLTLLGKGKEHQLTMLIASLVALAIGGISVFFHLQHPLRMLNGFGHITSGITIELIFIVIFAVVLVLYFLMMRRSEEGVAPKWCAVLAVVISLALPFAMGDSYLMPSIPVWDTYMLPVYYVVDSIFFGAVATAIIMVVRKADADILKLVGFVLVVGAVVTVLVNILYAIFITTMGDEYSSSISYYFDPTLPDVAMRDTSYYIDAILYGFLAPWFWLGVVVVGCLVPAVFGFALWKGSLAEKLSSGQTLAAAIGVAVCTAFGGFVWRVLLYVVAVNALIQFQL
jgi:anaerobic dimethyl sulfoxide reductase subunit C (anchor subunit)